MATVGGGDPCPDQGPQGPASPHGGVRCPRAPYQEPASWASPRLGAFGMPAPSLLITPHSPPAGTCLPTPTLRREGVPMAPRPPHTLSSLAAHLPQPVSSRCRHTQQCLNTASQARLGGLTLSWGRGPSSQSRTGGGPAPSQPPALRTRLSEGLSSEFPSQCPHSQGCGCLGRSGWAAPQQAAPL